MRYLAGLVKNFFYQSCPFLETLAVSAVIVVATLLLYKKFARLLFSLLRRLPSRVQSPLYGLLLDALSRPAQLVLALTGFYFAAAHLNFGQASRSAWLLFCLRSYRVGIIALVTWAAVRFVTPELLGLEWLSRAEEAMGKTFCLFFARVIKAIALLLGGVIIINELGYNVGGLITGIGLGGLTLALAAQDWAANLFGGAVILLDKPFAVDDWIQTDDTLEGVVEDITFRTTRVRTFDHSQIIVPNALLVSKPITNWSRMEKRKVSFDIDLTYDSAPEALEGLTGDIKELLAKSEDVDQEMYTVTFSSFSDSSLKVKIHYFSKLTGYLDYMNCKERINFAVMRLVRQRGLSFAFPTRTVQLESSAGAPEKNTPWNATKHRKSDTD